MKTTVLKNRRTLKLLVAMTVLVLLTLASLEVGRLASPRTSSPASNVAQLQRSTGKAAVCESADDETARALARMGINVICSQGGVTPAAQSGAGNGVSCESANDETARALARMGINVICSQGG